MARARAQMMLAALFIITVTLQVRAAAAAAARPRSKVLRSTTEPTLQRSLLGAAPTAPSTQAPAKAAGVTMVVSARLLSCLWPTNRLIDIGGTSRKPVKSRLAGVSPLAKVRVGCVYTNASAATAPASGSPAITPALIPVTLAIKGMPLEHCAVGVPLQLPFLLTLRQPTPALPGAMWGVLRSVPLVGRERGGALGGKGAADTMLTELFCLVNPPPAAEP